ncbi:hypothetical protein [Pseudomonas syringae]|uniref:hypothetical protein n=1 Tax=Pseudomonas syringae TaxID=317 RepID=UPI000B0767FF|nr:hypothetical protein [Pseudomonas syringae]
MQRHKKFFQKSAGECYFHYSSDRSAILLESSMTRQVSLRVHRLVIPALPNEFCLVCLPLGAKEVLD